MNFPSLQWNNNNVEDNLKQLADYAILSATDFKSYYQKNSVHKRGWAKFLRVTAILSTAVGGLLPILSQIFSDKEIHYLDPAWATVAISIAITAIGLDRFFGFSSAWMRFVTTEIKIESRIEQFQLSIENEKFSWAGNKPTFDTAKSMLSIIAAFINEISDIVKDETNTWMVEFQNVIQKFNEEANVKAESSKLGGITIALENSEKFEEITIQLEGNESVTFKGSSYSFNNLYPKIYKLSVTGILIVTKDNKPEQIQQQSNTLVNVTSGNVTAVSIKLL